MPHISLKNHSTEYLLQGSGPQTIFLIHGLGFDKTGWGPFAEQLAKHFRLVSFDARGVGAADNGYEQITTEEMAEDALELIVKLEIEKPIILGFSMGGMVAQHLAKMTKPGELRALVLLSTTEKPNNRSAELLRLWRDMIAAKVDRSIIYRDQFLWANEEAFFAQPTAIQDTLDYLMQNPSTQSIKGFVAQANACINHEGSASCHLIDTPTLVLVGPEERVFSVADSERLHSIIRHSTLVRLRAGGHNAWLEHPEDVAKALLAALQKNP